MAEGKDSQAWNHTAAVMALLSNIHRARGVSARTPKDFHPYVLAERRGAPPGPARAADSAMAFQILRILAERGDG